MHSDIFFIKPFWIVVRLFRHLSVVLFATLPFDSCNLWWFSALSPFGDCRHELIAATLGLPELPVDPEDNKTGEAMESDSLVN